MTCDQTLGTCTCKSGVLGRRCDECGEGFYGLLLMDNNPGVCKRKHVHDVSFNSVASMSATCFVC